MTDLRNDLGIPDLPVIVGQLAEWNWTKKPYIPEGTKPFNDMIKDISSFLPNSRSINPIIDPPSIHILQSLFRLHLHHWCIH